MLGVVSSFRPLLGTSQALVVLAGHITLLSPPLTFAGGLFICLGFNVLKNLVYLFRGYVHSGE